MKPAAFLFDLDGTLVETEAVWSHAIVNWLADRGVTVTFDDVMRIVCGRSQLDIHAALHNTWPAMGKSSPLDDAKELKPHYLRLAQNPQSQIIPGSVAFYRKAARMAPCAVVSGSLHADVAAAVALCGLTSVTKFVLGAEDYSRGKPAPDGYLEAAARLDVDASDCVVVEDSTAGVKSGRAAGMHVLALDRNAVVPQDLSGAEWIVHDLSEFSLDAIFEE